MGIKKEALNIRTSLGIASTADGGSRTHTMSPPSDFESDASAIPPHPLTQHKVFYHNILNISR